MTGKQLKNSILQWAIQGKLVPQDPNDEPASILLEKIRAEKARLIKEGKIKKDKKETIIYRGEDNSYYEKFADGKVICIDNEIPFEIPDGWEWSRLKEVSIILGGYAFPSETLKGEIGTRVVRISDFNESGWVDKSIVRYNGHKVLSQYELQVNDLLLAMTGGTVGKSYLIHSLPEKMFLNQRVSLIRSSKLLPMYINLLLKSPFILELVDGTKNSTNDNISMENIASFLVPVPPLAEQKRIVVKIEELMPHVAHYDKARSELDKLNINAGDLLKKSILQEAIQGKLVPQDPNDEPATHLLQRIKEEKQKLVKEGKLKKKDAIDSAIFRGEDNSYYEKLANGKVVCIDDEIPFEIPDGWVWCRLNDIVTSITDFVASGSFASLRENVRYYNTKEFALLVRTKDLSSNFAKDLVYTDKHGYDFLSNSNLFGGELILPNIGASIGKVFIVPKLNIHMTLAPNSVMLRLDNDYTKQWLYNVFSSPFGYDMLWSISSSTAQGKFNKTDFRKVLIPLPPLAEQERIVEQIEKLRAVAASLAVSAE